LEEEDGKKEEDIADVYTAEYRMSFLSE